MIAAQKGTSAIKSAKGYDNNNDHSKRHKKCVCSARIFIHWNKSDISCRPEHPPLILRVISTSPRTATSFDFAGTVLLPNFSSPYMNGSASLPRSCVRCQPYVRYSWYRQDVNQVKKNRNTKNNAAYSNVIVIFADNKRKQYHPCLTPVKTTCQTRKG